MQRQALELSGNFGKVPNGLNQALAGGAAAVADWAAWRTAGLPRSESLSNAMVGPAFDLVAIALPLTTN